MGKDSLIKINTVKLLSLEYRSGLACLAVFLRMYFGKCAQSLQKLVPHSFSFLPQNCKILREVASSIIRNAN